MTGADRAPAPGLSAQHHWLFHRVTEPGLDAEAALAPHALPSPAPRDEDARWVRGGRLPASERIEVYRTGYFARLVECLADDYPAVADALGPSMFRAACLAFIDVHPPTSASLNFYGAPFAAFCATWPAPLAACVSELARLEWAVVEAIRADADAVLDPAELGVLAEADWARARLVPSPALRVLHVTYPVHRHYSAFLEGESPPLPDVEPATVAVCRRGDVVRRLDVAAPFATLLADLTGGVPLARALEAFASAGAGDDSSSPVALQRVLREWVASGLFAAVALD